MKKIFVLGLLVFFVIGVTPAFAAVDYYLKLDGVDGESSDDNHKKWIDVLSIGWGMHQPGGGSSQRQAPVQLNEFTVEKHTDKSTPKLSQATCGGTFFKEVKVDVCSTETGIQHCFYKVTLKNARVSSYQTSGAAGEVPTESFSLNYEEIKVEYIAVDDTGGETSETAVCSAKTGSG